ncbi:MULTISPECIES: hypothetical protein [unclassified Mucilaginibacter]|uniref:hypothetical protein n=1 Tax=unclassified Mucilaginibacter TaxID=2617802 RepID=UPI002AC92F80|nr:MULTISPECIES: hypothetical protein [unclassified Mucilaginibacter]MEB0264092.1 hypothetical protein [Mucilaginibacter sp. 10I4]MEB0278381.1 hypothetical protein [Mucilaginibacter sp. 10B2]MEB0300998.1 hypothetical protein [Mucilaginibacter sp. 5C4]WPX24026.1 hypothetical protein RHM67_01885 [Mucilaginibacter sp. 5C4]
MFKSALLKAITVVSFIVALTGCDVKKEKFTTEGWDEGDGITFPKRAGMIDDLLATRKLKGLTYKQALGLLKYPQRTGVTERNFEYEIIRKMDGIDTVYAKSLVLYLNKDSVVSDYKVPEKNNKEKLKLKFEKQKAAKK